MELTLAILTGLLFLLTPPDFFFGCKVSWLISIISECWAVLTSIASSPFGRELGFRISFTRSAYLNELRVCSVQEFAGLTFAIIVVLLLPVRESFRTRVSIDCLNYTWSFCWSRALMHSLRASKLVLISRPSLRVFLSLSVVSAPLSDPARSMKLILA
jgi:hypothetical protein